MGTGSDKHVWDGVLLQFRVEYKRQAEIYKHWHSTSDPDTLGFPTESCQYTALKFDRDMALI